MIFRIALLFKMYFMRMILIFVSLIKMYIFCTA